MTALVAVLLTAPASPPAEGIELLEFSADYCQPCRTIEPRIDALIEDGYPIRKVDISREPQLTASYRIKRIPSFVLLIDGRERHRYIGPEHVGKLKPLMDAAREYVDRREARADAEAKAKEERQAEVERRAEEARRKAAAKADQPKEKSIFAKLFGDQDDEPERLDVVRSNNPQKDPAAVGNGAMASSVRVRVTYDGKVQYGSGTVVLSRQGRTVILTCAHIMDQAGDNPKVQVDLFTEDGKGRTFVGKVIGHDIKSDVGLIAIPTSTKLAVAQVVSPSEKLVKGQKVFSIGCSNGRKPTRENTTLSSIDRYVGPNNIETGNAPEHGRSGGGLFDSRGRVIGVCSAADHKGNHGLYAGNKAIYEFLKKHKLLAVYGDKKTAPPTADPMPGPSKLAEVSTGNRTIMYDSLTAPEPFRNHGERKMALANPTSSDASGIPAVVHPGRNDSDKQARRALEELGGDAEVTVVIRPRDPYKPSQIVVIPHASAHFIAMLNGELDSQPEHTSFVRPVAERELPITVNAAPRLKRYTSRPLAVTRSRLGRVHKPVRYSARTRTVRRSR